MSHPGFNMHNPHGFPSFSAPTFPMQYPMPMSTPMYMPPYGYPYVPQGPQAMQPNTYPGPPFMMQNFPIPNYPMAAPMYPPPSGYPFTMPAPQDANSSYGHTHQYSMGNSQVRSDLVKVDETYIPPSTDLSMCEILAGERTPSPTPET